MKYIVIFGATGNVGTYFTDYCATHLDASEYRVIAAGRRKTDYFEKHGIEYHNVDICRWEDFDSLPTENVHAVVNLAGLLPAYMKEYDPFRYIDVNIKGSLRILEYSRKCGADRVLYAQTWAEQAGYWGKEEVLRPEMPRKLQYTGDHAIYTISKCAVVDMMEHYKQEYGIRNFVFRLPNVYLYNPQCSYYVDGIEKPIAYRYLIERAIAGEDLEMWGDPDAFKDVLYVKDLCRMMYLALFADVNGGTYNAGTGVKTTLREQIEGIIKVFSPHPEKTRIIEKPEKPSFTSFVMYIGNAFRDLGYVPEYSYIDYLEDYKKERESKRFDSIWEVQ